MAMQNEILSIIHTNSIIVESMVKFIWQDNLPKGFIALSKCPLEGWIFGAKRATNGTPLKLQN